MGVVEANSILADRVTNFHPSLAPGGNGQARRSRRSPARTMFDRMRPLVLVALLAIACQRPGPVPAPAPAALRPDLTFGEVARLRRTRQYFELRDRLSSARDTTSAPVLFARAILDHALNRPAASNAALQRLRATANLSDSATADSWDIEISNDLRLGDYAAGAKAVDSFLGAGYRLDSLRALDVRNTQRVFNALLGTPAQTVSSRGASDVRFTEGRIPVTINGGARDYGFDTGANLSTIMRSEAAALHLRVIPAGIDVGTSTSNRITADLGVADSVRIGAMQFRNVVFLVLDDALLTFPGGFRIPGIIGFPVIEQMGEFRISGRASLVIPANPPTRDQRNLVLDELTLLTPARWEGRPLLCRLDTGAGHTQVYEPFYRRFRTAIDPASDSAERKMGGAGGVERTPVRVLTNARLATGDTVASLATLDVVTRSIARDESENYLDCNLGHDVFDQFHEMIVNFRDMAFLLR
jgi:hypothetical protein